MFNQLLKTNSNGDQLEHTAVFELWYREEGTTPWLTFFDAAQVSLTGKTSGGYVKDFVKAVPRSNNNYEIKVRKVSGDNVPNETVIMTWESFQAVTVTKKAYDNLALIRGIGRASDQFSGIPTFSGIYAGKLVMVPSNYDPVLRYYSGSWDGTFKEAHTDNPVWCLYDLLTNTSYGLRRYYPDLLVDRFTFYDAAQWCDGLVEIGTSGTYQPRWTYNDRIDQARNALELIYQICGIFGGILVSDLNGTVTLKVDRPGAPIQIFAPESVTSEGFQYQFSDISQRVNDVTVRFTNPNLDWNEDVRNLLLQEYITLNGRITDDGMVALGCNDVHEAQRRGHRKLLQANTETLTVSFQTTRQAMSLELFDIIGINDPHMNWGLSGRVKSVSGTTITLRDALSLPVATDLTMSVQTSSGVYDLVVQSSTAVSTQLVIQSGTYPVDAPLRAQFALTDVGSLGLTKPFRILQISENQENRDLISITALEQNVNKYGDTDTLATTGSVDYGFQTDKVPGKPTIQVIDSGGAHTLLSSDGTIQNRIYVRWSQGSSSLSRSFVLHYRRKGMESFQHLSVQGTEAYVPNAQVGVVYEIRVRAVNGSGTKGAFSTLQEHTPVGDMTPPAVPLNPTAAGRLSDITVGWDAVTDADLAYYEVCYKSSATVPGTTPTSPVVRVPDSSFTLSGLAVEYTRYFFIRAVDTSLNKSAWSTSVLASTGKLAGGDIEPGTVTLSEIGQDVQNQIDSAGDANVSAAAAASSATAANTSKTAAETAQAAASTSETNAAISKTGADDAAAGAVAARDVAAKVYSGEAYSNPIFAQWSGTYPDGITNVSVIDGSAITKSTVGVYGNAIDMDTGSALTANRPSIQLRSTTAEVQLPDAESCEGVHYELEVELLSGISWDGFQVATAWIAGGTGGTLSIVKTYLSDHLKSDQGRQTLAVDIQRPSDYMAGNAAGYVRIWIYGTSNGGGYSRTQNITRIHRISIRGLNTAASSLIQQKAIADLDGNALSSLVLRTKAGSSDGSVEIVSLSDASNAATATSKIKLTATEIELDGMAVFTGPLQSDDFVNSSVGWQITKAGAAEFNQLIVRQSLVDGSVSNGQTETHYVNTPTSRADSVNFGNSLQPGAWALGDFWNVAFKAEYRHAGTGSTNDYWDNDDGRQEYDTYIDHTSLQPQWRTKTSGVWGSWVALEAAYSAISTSTTVWTTFDKTYLMQGYYENVEFRLRIKVQRFTTINNIGTNTASFIAVTNCQNGSLVAKAVQR
jgi:predicted phage tail protein